MYGIRLDDIKMNGKSMGLCGPQGKEKDCIITVDSGTTFASVPGWAYSEIMGKVPLLIMASIVSLKKILASLLGLLTVRNILWKLMNGFTHPLIILE